MKRLQVFSLAAVLLSAAASLRAQPEGPTGLDILPSLLELSLRAGDRIERSVALTNPSAQAVPVVARVRDWSMSESGEVAFGDPGSQPRSCAAWIRVEPEALVVPARGRSTVRVVITSASDFSGTRWAAVLFSLGEVPGSLEGRPVTFEARLGLTIYVNAEGTEREDLKLAGASASAKPNAGALLQAVFENTGNTAVRVRVTWQVRTPEGRIVGTYAARSVSLPGSRRVVAAGIDEPLPAGRYQVTAMARWGTKRWQSSDCALVIPARSATSS
jgi:hypothetical protein